MSRWHRLPQISAGLRALAISLLGAAACSQDVGLRTRGTAETDTVVVTPPATPRRSRSPDSAVATRVRKVLPTTIRKLGGDGQTGTALAPLAAPLVVRVTDAAGRPLGGVRVKWTTTGGGRVRVAREVTSRNGLAWAHWAPGATADVQVTTAVVANLPPVSFYAAVPVVSISLVRDSITLWAGDRTQLEVILRDASGNTLAGGPVSWSSTDTRIAGVAGAGLVSALGQGAASILARIGSRTAWARIVVLPVLHGQVISPEGRGIAGLRLVVKRSAETDSIDVAPSGRFILRLPALAPEGVEVYVDAINRSTRRYYPSLIQVEGDELKHEFRVVLVPTRWTLPSGRFAGQTVDISLAEALAPLPGGSSFWRVASRSGRSRADAVGWPAAAFPIPVAFRRTSPTPFIRSTDSVAFWAVIQTIEEDFGADLFRPARGNELTAEASRIVIVINPRMTSDGFTFISWNGAGTVYDGSVMFRRGELLGAPFVVTHEMLHALGFGHTSSWPSVMSVGPGRPTRATLEDVAYGQVILRVRAAQAAYRAPHGIAAAVAAERLSARR